MRSRWLGVVVVALMWVGALAVFGDLPSEVPTHWDLRGQVDGWMPRWPGAFIAPMVATVVVALMSLLPWIDPRKRHVEHSSADRMLIVNVLVLFFALLEGLTLGAALGYPVDVSAGLMLGLGAVLVVMGNYLPRIRSNWWLGIRTPWTLDNDQVWRDTHRLGGRLFVAGGVGLIAAAMLPPEPRGWAALAVILVIAVVPIAYSFIIWRRGAS